MIEDEAPPPRPVNRDILYRLLKKTHLSRLGKPPEEYVRSISPLIVDGTAATWAALGEWFDFGRVDESFVNEVVGDVQPFVVNGLVKPPYPNTIFRVRVVAKSGLEMEYLNLIFEREDGLLVLPIMISGLDYEYMRAPNTYIIKKDGTITTEGRGNPAGHMMKLKLFFGLWMILNTKHIRMTKDEPDAKLNKARTKAGKPPLRTVTRIDVAQYVTALRETERREQGGDVTRLSPRMHLRRSHIRHLPNGKVIWIKPMIVGSRDEGVKRDGYVVKAPIDYSASAPVTSPADIKSDP